MRPILSLALLSLLSIGLMACDGDSDTGEGTNAAGGSSASLIDSPLLGLVFVQPVGVGFASYHFDAADDIYINYEDFQLPMGNGATVPPTKAFTATSFDADQRTFHGTIDWSHPEGTTVLGTQVWVYEMIFDESYSQVSGGSVTAYSETGAQVTVSYFGSDLFYDRL